MHAMLATALSDCMLGLVVVFNGTGTLAHSLVWSSFRGCALIAWIERPNTLFNSAN